MKKIDKMFQITSSQRIHIGNVPVSEKGAIGIAWTGHRPRAYSVQYSRYRAQRLVPGQTQTAAFI